MNNVLLITDTLDKSLYTRIKVSSRTAMQGVDKHGQMLTQLTPEYLYSHNGKGCCGDFYDVVGFATDSLNLPEFTYLLSRVGKESRSIVEAPVWVSRYYLGVDENTYKRPENSTEFFVELYEALSGDREVLDMLESTEEEG